jgi:hypothetical protein
MADVLAATSLIGGVLGLALGVVGLVAIVAWIGDPHRRLRALGFVYVGLAVVAASGAVFLVSRFGDRLPPVAGLPPVVLLLVIAAALRVGASRSFRESRATRDS